LRARGGKKTAIWASEQSAGGWDCYAPSQGAAQHVAIANQWKEQTARTWRWASLGQGAGWWPGASLLLAEQNQGLPWQDLTGQALPYAW